MSKKPTVDSLIYEDLGNCLSCPHNKKKKNKLKTSYFLEKLERQIFTMKTGKTGKYEESQLA